MTIQSLVNNLDIDDVCFNQRGVNLTTTLLIKSG